MIFTPCEACCFLRRDTGCTCGQYTIQKEGRYSAPGFCRLMRTQVWVKRQTEKFEGVPETARDGYLKHLARQEIAIQADLIVVFNSKYHEMGDLEFSAQTLEGGWIKRLILIDTTGADQRLGIPEQFIKDGGISIPYQLDIRVEPTMGFHEAVHRGAALVQAPYFLALKAGESLHIDRSSKSFQEDVRCALWSFSRYMRRTTIFNPFDGCGLYLTEAFRRLGGNTPEQTFVEKLRMIEPSLKMALIHHDPEGRIFDVRQ